MTATPELLPCLSLRQLTHVRHGHTLNKQYSPTYHSWQAMLARTRYLKRDRDKKHIGRGISICDRWKSFDAFLADMGERPPGTTLDRIENDKGYEPGNCRWATPRQQARNTRRNVLTFDSAVAVAMRRLAGVTCTVIAKEYGISESLPREIVRGRAWPDALAEAKRRMGIAQ